MTEDGKIGMDGGAVYGGVLHGIVFTDQGMTEHHFIEMMVLLPKISTPSRVWSCQNVKNNL